MAVLKHSCANLVNHALAECEGAKFSRKICHFTAPMDVLTTPAQMIAIFVARGSFHGVVGTRNSKHVLVNRSKGASTADQRYIM